MQRVCESLASASTLPIFSVATRVDDTNAGWFDSDAGVFFCARSMFCISGACYTGIQSFALPFAAIDAAGVAEEPAVLHAALLQVAAVTAVFAYSMSLGVEYICVRKAAL